MDPAPSPSHSAVTRRTALRAMGAGSAAVGVCLLAACGSGSGSSDSLTFRLWDEGAAKAYEEALKTFTQDTGIQVAIETVPWADYWTSLRNDIAAGSAPDVFWTNSSNFTDYAAGGKLLNIDQAFPDSDRQGWIEEAITQYTFEGTLWGVPALADPNIAVYYNKELLDAADLAVEDLADLAWDPSAEADTLREITSRLTLDSAGRTPADDGFDAGAVVQFGFNAALDLQAIILNFLGSNGARYQDDDGHLAFASPEGTEAFGYLADLVNTHHVAPSAADTNTNGDFSRDQFIQGKMGLFQSGAYNLANIHEGAGFEWGIVPLPAGPAGNGGVTNTIVAAGSASSANAEGQKELLAWIASADGSRCLGDKGVGLPGNSQAQEAWSQYWQAHSVDVSAMTATDTSSALPGPFGSKIQGAMEAANKVLQDVFLGTLDAETGVRQAQDAGNGAIDG